MRNFNSKNFVTIFILTILFNSMNVFSQVSQYFKSGTTGFGVSSGILTNDAVSRYTFSGEYAVNSILDLGLSFGKLTTEVEGFSSDINAIAISPKIGIHLIRQNQNFPISCYIAGAYEKNNFSGEILDDFNVKMNGSEFRIDGLIFRSLQASPNFSLIPNIGIIYKKTTRETKDNSGNTMSKNDDETSFSVGLSFAFRLKPNQIFFFDPGVLIDRDNTSFRLSLGLAFPTNRVNFYDNSFSNEISKNNDPDFHFTQKKSKYLKIRSMQKKYLLVYIDEFTPMDLGDTYPIVRYNGQHRKKLSFEEIGTARVLKISGNRVAMEFNLSDARDMVTTQDMIAYK